MAKQSFLSRLTNNILSKKEALFWATVFYLLGHFTGDWVLNTVKSVF